MRLATLLTLADSRLPTGGHVHSGGVEEAVASGLVRDVETVEAFLRRRIRTSGLVAASIAAAVCAGELEPTAADLEADARTPAPAARGPRAILTAPRSARALPRLSASRHLAGLEDQP